VSDQELKAWAVQLEQNEQVRQELGRLVQPAAKEQRRDWTLVRGDKREVVGDTKLAAIAQVRQMFADLIPAPEATTADQTVEQIEARLAELEAEIALFEGKPEFAKAASARRGQITRLAQAAADEQPPGAGQGRGVSVIGLALIVGAVAGVLRGALMSAAAGRS
jgi:hypothetical protein